MRRLFAVILALLIALPAFAADGNSTVGRAPEPTFTMAFTGDVLIHSSVWRSAQRNGGGYNFDLMFRPTRHLIAGADIAICHLESPVMPSRGPSGFPRFNAPRQILDGLVYAGFDGCSAASNHSNDQGPEGIISTLTVMEQAGLVSAGMRATRDDGMIGYYEAAGARVANISATYGLNGLELPEGRTYMVQMLNEAQILAEARTARELGADLVVVSIHCCVEYRTMPTDTQRAIAHRLISSDDIDMIVSHHAHVVGPIEWVNSKPVLHGLGNFLSNQSARAGLPAHTQDGVIAMATARRDEEGWKFTDVGVIPTWVDEPGNGHVIRVATPGSTPFNRTMTAINMMGASVPVYELPQLSRRVASRVD